MSSLTPKRGLAKPRKSSLGHGIITTSTPNLAAVYTAHGSSTTTRAVARRPSQGTLLTQDSLAALPDAPQGYALSAALGVGSQASRKMPPFPAAPGEDGDLQVGDVVDVPGNMHGVVKFVGNVRGKKGTFAGVELSEVYASRGKNNGDVDGVSYFNTSVEGAGIFLPLNKAIRRESSTTSASSFAPTPTTPSISSVRIGGQSSNGFTPPTPSLPKFSQSVGPGRASSPLGKKPRPSLPRAESPIRKMALTKSGPRPSLGTPTTKAGVRYAASPTPTKFGQSVRGTKDSGDPAKKVGFAPRTGMQSGSVLRSASAFGQTPLNYSDEESTPIGVARTKENGSTGSSAVFDGKVRPVESRANEEEVARLRTQLEERDKQLREQASTLAEMENSLAEVQSLMGGSDGTRNNRGSMEDKDSAHLRALIREKNEKIAMLTSEFDAHRADFRSTIDTLELASTETERVYERRVEDLIQEVRDLRDRNEDVDSFSTQLKQLEELVQELEEGLEDARRGEAEARGEVEFLRGEVERGRSELRREREKAAASVNGSGAHGESGASQVEQRDDEIRGLKAIIHSLSRDAVPENVDGQKPLAQRNGSFSRGRRTSAGQTIDADSREKWEREIADLRLVIEKKTTREDELERELERVRRGSASGPVHNHRASALTVNSTGTVTQERSSIRDSKGTVTQDRSSIRDSKGTLTQDRSLTKDSKASVTQDRSSSRDSKGAVVSWRDRELRNKALETMQESDTYSSATDSSALWCEICETGGHDILTCTNMFGANQGVNGNDDHPAKVHTNQQRTGRDVVREGLKDFSPKVLSEEFKPAPLQQVKVSPTKAQPFAIIPNPMEQGPVAGKESGVVDANKWCALCERDGHESVDCPFEDAF